LFLAIVRIAFHSSCFDFSVMGSVIILCVQYANAAILCSYGWLEEN
jgi:hypothetical protein